MVAVAVQRHRATVGKHRRRAGEAALGIDLCEPGVGRAEAEDGADLMHGRGEEIILRGAEARGVAAEGPVVAAVETDRDGPGAVVAGSGAGRVGLAAVVDRIQESLAAAG